MLKVIALSLSNTIMVATVLSFNSTLSTTAKNYSFFKMQ
ncbi:hypothetical protein BTN50_0069 [Candidatus Enterovibrio altilux]|uniref:Uncharacterized protein n=1 Tax=Candidatus Enterovibrio altilux TaxID=1927128 RepID=A0A291B6J1_9GAMM|nr:hypothetical protein BTN50_0069 [Candidatus Enterovibrio luxaltus]